MGNNQGGQKILSKEDFDKLLQSTHYTREELKQLHKQFMDEVPGGIIAKEEFPILTDMMGIKDDFVTKLLFNAFDSKHDGKIDFIEFINAFSILNRGNPDEKLEFSFKMYDLNNDGYITKDEMIQIVSSLYNMLGDFIKLQGPEYDTPQKLVDKLFKDIDSTGQSKISLLDFKRNASKDKNLAQGLGIIL